MRLVSDQAVEYQNVILDIHLRENDDYNDQTSKSHSRTIGKLEKGVKILWVSLIFSLPEVADTW